MRWVAWRGRRCTTVLGALVVERAYWVCPVCGTGHAPDDARWGLPPGQTTWAVQHGVALLGQALPFAQAADVYTRLTGVPVSSKSVESWTEAVGQAYAPPVPDRYTPGPAADTLFVLADAGQMPLRGPEPWKERKVFAAWRRVEGEEAPIRYAVGTGHWDEQTQVVADLARREGSRRARTVVCLADGAEAIWKLLTRLWPEAVQLLDWFHLMEHLAKVVAVHPDGAVWQTVQQAALRTQGPRPTLRALATLARTGATAELRTAARDCLRYMWAHRHRMDYPTALQRGYPIGSGRIEAAVKQVLQTRCKQTGMRWESAHLDWVLAVRCAYLNGDWDLACQQVRQAA